MAVRKKRLSAKKVKNAVIYVAGKPVRGIYGVYKRELMSVGVLSSARIGAVLLGFLGLLYGFLFSFMAIFSTDDAAFGLGGWAIVVFPAFFAAVGFTFSAISAFLYNFLAGLAGGVQLEFARNGDASVLKRIGVLSFARIYALLLVPFGLVLGILIGLFTFLPLTESSLSITSGLLLSILFPFIFGALGFVLGVFWAFFYNVSARIAGGVVMEFVEPRGYQELKGVGVLSCALVNALYNLFFGLLFAAVYALVFVVVFAAQGMIVWGIALAVLFLVFIPVMNGVSGFVAGAVSALLYNLCAKLLGGVRLGFRE